MNLKQIFLNLILGGATLCACPVLFTACTHEMADASISTNPQLPEGVIGLNFKLSGSKPVFTENGTGTRADYPAVPGAVADKNWKEGDELMVRLALSLENSPYPIDYVIFTYARYDADGDEWILTKADKSHSVSLTELPVLVTAPGTNDIIGIRPAVGASDTKFRAVKGFFAYTSNAKWSDIKNNDGMYDICTVPNVDPSSVQLWVPEGVDLTIGVEGSIDADNGNISFPDISFTTRYSRLRVYTGRPNDKVKMIASHFATSLAETRDDGTFTATTDAYGNAYFYGYFGINSTVTISLPEVQVPGEEVQDVVVYNGEMVMNAEGGSATAIDASFGLNEELMYTAIFNPASYATYAEFKAALTGAHAVGRTIWKVMGTENKDFGSGNTVLKGIKESLDAVYATDANTRIHLYIPEQDVSFSFANSPALERVVMPVTQKAVKGMFDGCVNLQSVSLPAATTFLGPLFTGCSNLTTIRLTQPGAWKSIGNDLFGGFDPVSCIVYLAESNYSIVGVDGESWSPKTSEMGSAIVNNGSSDYQTFVCTSGSTGATEVGISERIKFQ